jgi:hypothetical protein
LKKRRVKIKFDKEGWALVGEHKPPKFDLVIVQNHSREEQLAWWLGYAWDYGKKKINGDPYRWKRLPRGYEFT